MARRSKKQREEVIIVGEALIDEMIRSAEPTTSEQDTPQAQAAKPHPLCLCGCGEPVLRHTARFRSGHDRKLHAKLARIEAGELDEDAIPEGTMEQLGVCTACGKVMFPHPSGMGPVCRQRAGWVESH